MIELFTGKPGSGKSYYAVSQMVEYIKQDRRVWCVIDVVMSEYWCQVSGKDYEDVESRLLIRKDLSFLNEVQPGDVVVVDECQRFMRAGSEPDKSLLFFLETHRHHGIDIILVTQDYMKILRQVYVLAENVFRFRKMAFLGVNKARVRVCTGVKEDDEIRAFWMSYNPKYFTLYKSYFKDGVNEKTNKKMLLWKSPILIIAVVMIGLVVYVIGFRHWITPASANIKEVSGASSGVSKSEDRKEGVMIPGVSPTVLVKEYVIVGTVCSEDVCFISLQDGRIMTPETLVGLVGSGVVSVQGGFKKVLAEGVSYAGMGFNFN